MRPFFWLLPLNLLLSVLLRGAALAQPPAGPAAGSPHIGRVWPRVGEAGTVLMLKGRGLATVTAVRLGAVPMAFTVRSGRCIAATIPAGATDGPISVTTADGRTTTTPRQVRLTVGANARPAARATAAVAGVLRVWPNPASAGRATVALLPAAADPRAARLAPAPAPAEVAVTLTDATGRLVRQLTLPAAQPQAELPLDGLAPGVYLLRAGEQVQRLVVE